MRIALFTRQIRHYHNARFQAACPRFKSFLVVSLSNEANIPNAVSSTIGPYQAKQLYQNSTDYKSAARRGEISKDVSALLSMESPDVVAIAGWASPESYAAITWARRHNARVVVMSDSQAGDAPRLAWREAIKSRVLKYCDAGFVAGHSHAAYLESLGLRSEQITLGFDVIDNDYYAHGSNAARSNHARERARLKLPDRYILAAARFTPKKNLTRIIQAYAKAIKAIEKGPDLVIAGDGEKRDAIMAAIEKEGLTQRVHLPGFIDYSNMPSVLGLSEAFIHAPLTEQWGLVINEAAAAGLPLVISSTCGATNELVVDGENGFIVDPYDVDAIAAGLHSLFALSPDLRETMGAVSRRIIDNWGVDRFADGLWHAAQIASLTPNRIVPPWDAVLISLLSRQPPISTVS